MTTDDDTHPPLKVGQLLSPSLRQWAALALLAVEEWQEAIETGDILAGEVAFQKLRHFWYFMTSQYEAEQSGTNAHQYVCRHCGKIYSEREANQIGSYPCDPDGEPPRIHSRDDLELLTM